MVLDFYRLAEQPFGVTPDPRFIYPSATHREAFASVLYGLSAGRGFTALIAMPGMGKTTLLFDFLDRVRNACTTVFLFQSQCTPQGMLRSLLADLGIDDDSGDFGSMHRKLNERLVKESSRGKQLVVVIDEAQNLDEPVLEVVRMLSNFETPKAKLMHLILAGQPMLAEKLASPQLTQLRQRISIIGRLTPFDTEETRHYIDHRLRVAGYDFAKPLFTKKAQAVIASYSAGIPRNINNVCFNAMSLGCVAKQKTIDKDIIQEVIKDLDLGPMRAETTNFPPSEALRPLASSVSSQPRSRSWFRTWSVRFALTIALVALLSVATFEISRHFSNAPASSARQTLARPGGTRPTPTTSPAQDLAISPASAFDSSQAGTSSNYFPDDAFQRMSAGVKSFGNFLDTKSTAALGELSPWFTDPGAPRALRVPQAETAGGISKAAVIPPAERAPDPPGAGSEKQ